MFGFINFFHWPWLLGTQPPLGHTLLEVAPSAEPEWHVEYPSPFCNIFPSHSGAGIIHGMFTQVHKPQTMSTQVGRKGRRELRTAGGLCLLEGYSQTDIYTSTDTLRHSHEYLCTPQLKAHTPTHTEEYSQIVAHKSTHHTVRLGHKIDSTQKHQTNGCQPSLEPSQTCKKSSPHPD